MPPPRRKTILIVEDEPTTLEVMAGYFEMESYRVARATDSDEMQRVLEREVVDLIVLDLRLPGKDGLSVLRSFRSHSDLPVIVVSARFEDVDRIVALEVGADDYLAKPVNLRELLVRTRNLLRRCSGWGWGGGGPTGARLVFEGWRLDSAARLLTDPNGQEVHLTQAEFDLLQVLARRAGSVLSRDQLLAGLGTRVWKPADRTIDVLVRRLRSKIEADPSDPRMIVTVHGIGYVFRARTESDAGAAA